MRTECQDVDTEDFNFGLVCVDNVGRPVRHLFGTNSFENEETFDTLITCDQCLGLTHIPDDVMLNNEVLGLSREVKELGGMMKIITGTISKLNQEVSSKPSAAAPVTLHSTMHGRSKQRSHSRQHRGLSKRQRHRQQQNQEEERREMREEEEDMHQTLEMRHKRSVLEKQAVQEQPDSYGPSDDVDLAPEGDVSDAMVDDGFED